MPSTSSKVDDEPTTSSSRGKHADLDAERLDSRIDVEDLVLVVAVRGDDHALDVVLGDDSPQRRYVTQDPGRARGSGHLVYLRDHTSQDGRLDSRRARQLAGGSFCVCRVAQHNASLRLRQGQCGTARDCTTHDRQHEARSRERKHLGTRQTTVEQDPLHQPDRQAIGHSQMEDRRHLVDRCLAQAVLVPVVETDRFAHQNDERACQHHGGPQVHGGGPHTDGRDDQRQVRRDQVREGERTPRDRIPPEQRGEARCSRATVGTWDHLPYRGDLGSKRRPAGSRSWTWTRPSSAGRRSAPPSVVRLRGRETAGESLSALLRLIPATIVGGGQEIWHSPVSRALVQARSEIAYC